MPAPVYVCVWYDTEDYATPESDDAALRLAQLHTRLGFPATFKVVGEKARRLRDRGRIDVIRALRAHDIGYHTNYHSVHPTIAEYCEALPWHQARERFEREERPGYDDVAAIFERPIVTYGQPGGAWAPPVYPALREWGVPTYVDEGRWIGLDEAPFRFMGVLHVMRMGQQFTRFDLRRPGDELDGVARFRQIARRLAETGGGVISLGFHPCEWATDMFWDAVNFDRGADTPLDALKSAPLAAPEEVERRHAAVETYLRQIRDQGVAPIGAGELPALYPDRAAKRYYGRDEILDLTAAWDDTVDCLRVDDGWLTPAEVLTVVAGLLRRSGVLPPGDRCRLALPLSPDGPLDEWMPLGEPVEVPFEDVVSACERLWEQLCPAALEPGETASRLGPAAVGPLPHWVAVGPQRVRPEVFLMGAIRALRGAARRVGRPERVTLKPTELLTARHVRDEPGVFGWRIFPPGFQGRQIMFQARLQAWTLKPALLFPRGR